MEESRKRKIGHEGAESSEQKSSYWVLDLDYVTWKDKLQYRHSLGEKVSTSGFSPFIEIIEGKGQ